MLTNSPQLIALSGTALAPVVTLSTQSLSFAAQAVSITSAPQTILLTNTGSGGLTPLTIGTTGDFAETNNCTVPVSPGIACTIGVTFTPTAGGVRNGTLTLTDNAVNSPQIVTVDRNRAGGYGQPLGYQFEFRQHGGRLYERVSDDYTD